MSVETSTWATKKGLAQMLKGGVIMDVVTAEQAKIAEDAGAVRGHGAGARARGHPRGGRRCAHERPGPHRGIMARGHHPGHGQGRIGHFVEAQVLEALGVDYIDESEVLTPADETTTSTSTTSRCRSSAAAATSARPCAELTRARP